MSKKKKIRELSMLTPFRIGDYTYIKMPLFDGGGLPCNAYCLEKKENYFFMPTVEVTVVNLIAEEI